MIRCCLTLLLFALLFSLTACQSTKEYEAIGQSFRSRISESGLKHFELRLRASRQDFEMRGPPQQSQNSPRKSFNRFDKVQRLLERSAEYTIAQNQYCRDGFWVLDQDVDLRGFYLRGECNEKATEADRQAYPDSIHDW
jgi:hypothetical protein